VVEVVMVQPEVAKVWDVAAAVKDQAEAAAVKDLIAAKLGLYVLAKGLASRG
jgi:hypothetical protein